MPVVSNREYRNMLTPLQAVNNAAKRFESDHYVEGYATTFNEPYVLWEFDGVKYYEEIASDALVGADVSDVIFQFNHEGRVLARLSNNTLGIEADSHGLLTFADLSKSDAARAIFEDIRAGLVTKMSWCFTIDKESYEQSTRTRRIEKIKKVYDVSAVSIPANDGTEIMARSFAQGRLDAERRESLAREIQRLKIKLALEGIA